MSGTSGRPFGAGHADRSFSHCPTPTTVVALTAGLCIAFATAAHAQQADEAAAQTRYETVVVAKPRNARAKEDDAASASVVTIDRTPRSAESAAELVSELPGVVVTRLGGLGAQATVSIRGSTSDQVGVYLDGIPLNTATGGGVNLGLVPISDMGRMEVYRGQSPMAFGASALGGVVSISPREIAGNEAEANLGGGSFGTVLGGARAGGTFGRFGVVGSLHVLRSAGDFSYASNNGTAFDPSDDEIRRRNNNRLVQTDGLLRAHAELPGRRRLTGSFWFLDRDQGLPGDGLRTAQTASLATRRLMVGLRYDARDDLGSASRFRAQLYGVGVEQRFVDPNAEIGLGQRQTRDRTLRLGTQLSAQKTLGGWLRLLGQTEARRETFDPHNELRGDLDGPPARRLFAAVGMEARAWLRSLRLQIAPSGRLEYAGDAVLDRDLFGNFANATRDEDRFLPIARLALVQRSTTWLQLRGNVGRYARLPSLRERYGNTGLFLGNPSLKPETGINADLGIRITAPDLANLNLDAAVFTAWVDDLIQLEKGAYQVRAANLDRAFVKGVETALSLAPWRYGRFIGQFTFSDARDTSDIAARNGKQLPLRPRVRAYVRPEVRGLPLGRGPNAWHFGVYGDVDHTQGNYLDAANLVSMPARTLLGAGVFVDIGDTGVRVIGSARNLGDASIFDLTGYPLPGRSFWLNVHWQNAARSTSQTTPKGNNT